MYSAGFVFNIACAASSLRSFGKYESGSCALVWSVTMSAAKPICNSFGNISAALPTTPTESLRFSAFAFSHLATASSSESATSSKYRVSTRRLTRHASTSMHKATPSFIVTASGCAPPMPPRPAVNVMVPASVPLNLRRAISAKHSYVPCKIP
ncbi:unannotated protein [freshwater metagenome]|uniref:Unannotated protein n=1 Tax=freshwater metagenome TaxID=449393 RepID=A0A6J6KNM0_9ZZZZ